MLAVSSFYENESKEYGFSSRRSKRAFIPCLNCCDFGRSGSFWRSANIRRHLCLRSYVCHDSLAANSTWSPGEGGLICRTLRWHCDFYGHHHSNAEICVDSWAREAPNCVGRNLVFVDSNPYSMTEFQSPRSCAMLPAMRGRKNYFQAAAIFISGKRTSIRGSKRTPESGDIPNANVAASMKGTSECIMIMRSAR